MTSIVKAVKSVVKPAAKPAPAAKKQEAAKAAAPVPATPPALLTVATVEPAVLPDLTRTEAGKPAAKPEKAAIFAKKPLPFDGSKTFVWVGPCPSKEGTKRAERYGVMQVMSGGTLKDLSDKVPSRYITKAMSKGIIKV
jgi:hypothetical protein